jgi:hypothetical protein
MWNRILEILGGATSNHSSIADPDQSASATDFESAEVLAANAGQRRRRSWHEQALMHGHTTQPKADPYYKGSTGADCVCNTDCLRRTLTHFHASEQDVYVPDLNLRYTPIYRVEDHLTMSGLLPRLEMGYDQTQD